MNTKLLLALTLTACTQPLVTESDIGTMCQVQSQVMCWCDATKDKPERACNGGEVGTWQYVEVTHQ